MDSIIIIHHIIVREFEINSFDIISNIARMGSANDFINISFNISEQPDLMEFIHGKTTDVQFLSSEHKFDFLLSNTSEICYPYFIGGIISDIEYMEDCIEVCITFDYFEYINDLPMEIIKQRRDNTINTLLN